MRISGKVAMVTGCGTGIGKEIASTLAREGADIVCNDIEVSGMNQTSDEVRQIGRQSLAIRADVSDYDQVRDMVTKAVTHFGQIDILVNNAAISDVSSKPEELRLDEWNKMMAVTLTGTFICSQLAGREMIKRKSGKIINIASTAGLLALPDNVHYVVAKHGVVGLTKSLALEWGRYGICVNCVAPGFTMTPTTDRWVQKWNPNYPSERVARIPLGRVGQPSDQAKVVAFLASPDSDYVSGQVVVVDGGTSSYYSGYSLPR